MLINIGNVTITTDDLKKIRPDIENYLFADQNDFSDQIAAANKLEYRNIAKQLRFDYPTYSEAEIFDLIGKIKDHPQEESLKDRRVLFTLAEIFSGNNYLDEYDHYQKKASNIPIRYYIDHDDDGVQDTDETRSTESRRITFGR